MVKFSNELKREKEHFIKLVLVDKWCKTIKINKYGSNSRNVKPNNY